MAKNRKRESAVVRFGAIIKALLVCSLLGGVGIGYVQQQDQLHLLGKQRKDREVKLDRLRRENERRLRDLDALQTPAKIEERIRLMNLGLVQPQPDQIVHLVERPADDVLKGGSALVAETSSRRVEP